MKHPRSFRHIVYLLASAPAIPSILPSPQTPLDVSVYTLTAEPAFPVVIDHSQLSRCADLFWIGSCLGATESSCAS